MAYDDSLYRRRDSDTTDPGMTGYRSEFPVGDFRDSDYADTAQRRPVPPAVLDDVFDDPSHATRARPVAVQWSGRSCSWWAPGRGLPPAAPRRRRVQGRAPETLLVSAAALGLLAVRQPA